MTKKKKQCNEWLDVIVVLVILIIIVVAMIIVTLNNSAEYEYYLNEEFGISDECYIKNDNAYCMIDGVSTKVELYYEVEE